MVAAARQGNFNMATRQKRAQVAPVGTNSFSSPYGNIVTFQIPRVGLLSRLFVTVRGTSNAVFTTTNNTSGFCSLIKRVRLFLNGGIEVMNFSGIGYHYGLAPILDQTFNPFPLPPGVAKGPRDAFAATSAFAVDFIIPVAMNLRDTQGLLMLQNEQLSATLTVEFAAVGDLGTGTAMTFSTNPTVNCYSEWFTLPEQDVDMPPLNTIHRIIEEQLAPINSSDYVYNWPRGNRYLQMSHVLIPQSSSLFQLPADTWTRYKVRVNTSDYLYDFDLPEMDNVHAVTAGTARLAGAIPLNLMGSAGLGMYDQARDSVNSADYTDLASIISVGALSGVISNIRREIMVLPTSRR